VRYVFAILAVLMLLAVIVQYNDPDGPLWMAYYGVPAIFAGIAAWRPHVLAGGAGRGLLVLAVAAAVALTAWYWPPVGGWWRNEVWTMGEARQGAEIAEQAREGMGLMIATAVLLAVLAATLLRRPHPQTSPR
jgi:hypothetical protein